MDELKAEENQRRKLNDEYEAIVYLQLRIRFNEEKVEGWRRDINDWTKFIAEQRTELRRHRALLGNLKRQAKIQKLAASGSESARDRRAPNEGDVGVIAEAIPDLRNLVDVVELFV